MTPGELAATNWHTWVSGKIKAPDRATCMNSKYDYFVVDRSIDHAVAGVQVLTDGGLYRHPPCRLCHRANKRRKKIRTLARLQKVPGRLPHGSAVSQESYQEVHDECDNGNADGAMTKWYELAGKEWCTMTGITDK